MSLGGIARSTAARSSAAASVLLLPNASFIGGVDSPACSWVFMEHSMHARQPLKAGCGHVGRFGADSRTKPPFALQRPSRRTWGLGLLLLQSMLLCTPGKRRVLRLRVGCAVTEPWLLWRARLNSRCGRLRPDCLSQCCVSSTQAAVAAS
jgi:hypothetical protein